MSGGNMLSRRAALKGAAMLGVAAGAHAAPAASKVQAFKGIRYARAERFKAPEPVRWPGFSRPYLRSLTRYGPSCPQQGAHYQPQSEDCLFLNVWAPMADKGRKRPVMVYIHGGAYSSGSVVDPLNDGAQLAERGDVVVVTVNHRLNAFGYLYLARRDPRFPDSGNCGQLDLICALQWVRDNIAGFGGDPDNVTVFGQSGGGAKIATLMAMPAADGLFHKAITMSGQQVTASGAINATKRTEAYLEKLGRGVDPVTASATELVAALGAIDPILGGGVYMGPVLDQRHLHRHPFWPESAPQGNKIPMLLGNTIAETRAFFPPDHPKLQGLDWDNLAERAGSEMRADLLPEWVVAQFRDRYPTEAPLQLFHRIVTAGRSWRGQVEEADARARAGVAATWVYQLDFEQAKHTDDIGLSFGTFASPTPARAAMSRVLMDAFVRFARTGHPGWPAYTTPSRATMMFDADSRVVNDPRQWERELFARVPFIQAGS
jgi:para-nitrobenzyl esterase